MSASMDSALNRYMEHMGPICDHHHDECPDDCEGQLAWQAERELAALRKKWDRMRELLTDIVEARQESCDALKACDPVAGDAAIYRFENAMRRARAALRGKETP